MIINTADITIKSYRKSFSLIELAIVILIIVIIAAIGIPKITDLRTTAKNTQADANIAAMRSAASAYYSKTAIAQYNYLCTTANPYRSQDTTAPCYPANTEELESLLNNTVKWIGDGGICYDAASGSFGDAYCH